MLVHLSSRVTPTSAIDVVDIPFFGWSHGVCFFAIRVIVPCTGSKSDRGGDRSCSSRLPLRSSSIGSGRGGRKPLLLISQCPIVHDDQAWIVASCECGRHTIGVLLTTLRMPPTRGLERKQLLANIVIATNKGRGSCATVAASCPAEIFVKAIQSRYHESYERSYLQSCCGIAALQRHNFGILIVNVHFRAAL